MLWLGVPLLGVVGLSVVIRPLVVDRYLMAAVPAAALLVALVLDHIQGYRWVGVTLVFALSWPAFRATFDPHTPDSHAATALVLDAGNPTDGIVFISGSRHIADYYWTQDSRVPGPTPLFLPHEWSAPRRIYPATNFGDAVEYGADFDRIWVLIRIGSDGYTTEARELVAELTSSRHLAKEWDYGAAIRVLLYERTPKPGVHATVRAQPRG